MRRFWLALLFGLCALPAAASATAELYRGPEQPTTIEAAAPRQMPEAARASSGLDFLRLQEESGPRSLDRGPTDRTPHRGTEAPSLAIGGIRALEQPRVRPACTPADFFPYFPTAPPTRT